MLACNGWGLVQCRRLKHRHRQDERSWIETLKFPNPLIASIVPTPCYAPFFILFKLINLTLLSFILIHFSPTIIIELSSNIVKSTD